MNTTLLYNSEVGAGTGMVINADGLVLTNNHLIGMDTAGNDASSQQATIGFAIPVNRALSVARQIAGGQASATVTIGYPPFRASSSAPDRAAARRRRHSSRSSKTAGLLSHARCGGSSRGSHWADRIPHLSARRLG
jgi:hypothetical protein